MSGIFTTADIFVCLGGLLIVALLTFFVWEFSHRRGPFKIQKNHPSFEPYHTIITPRAEIPESERVNAIGGTVSTTEDETDAGSIHPPE